MVLRSRRAAFDNGGVTKHPDLIFTGGNVWTMNPAAARAEAVAVTGGRISSRSWLIHQRQASISPAFGLLWMRFLPRATNLKCLTALVT